MDRARGAATPTWRGIVSAAGAERFESLLDPRPDARGARLPDALVAADLAGERGDRGCLVAALGVQRAAEPLEHAVVPAAELALEPAHAAPAEEIERRPAQAAQCDEHAQERLGV